MTKHELSIVAVPGAWRLYSARKADPKFQEIANKILNRDNYTCQYCGFKASRYQEVINIDSDYSNNSLNNMITACIFCSQCFFVESVGVGGYGGGTLIYMPEMNQAELNAMCHVLFCSITNDSGYKITAQSIYKSLRERAEAVEKKFGEGASNPAVLGQLVIEIGRKQQQNLNKIFADMRLLPSRAKFRRQIESWAMDTFTGVLTT